MNGLKEIESKQTLHIRSYPCFFHTKIKSLLPRFCYLLLLLLRARLTITTTTIETKLCRPCYAFLTNLTLTMLLYSSPPLKHLYRSCCCCLTADHTVLLTVITLLRRPSLPRSIQMDRLYRTQTRSPKVQISFRNS